jgi:glycosyltransferase involved in cell wall biosynthesis
MTKQTKTKITQISKYYHPFAGGLEVVAKQISEVMQSKGFELEVIALSENLKDSIESINGIPVRRCGRLFEFKSNPISLSFIRELSRVDTDILHYHHPYIFAAIVHFIARPKYKHLTVSYHGDITRQKHIMKFFNPVYEAFLNRADRIHVLSEFIKDLSTTLNAIKYKKNQIHVIPYGIPINSFQNINDENINKIKDIFNNKTIILYVGRFYPAKGVEYLIRAMNYVNDNAVLVLIGSGFLKKSLETIVSQNKLETKVFFTGDKIDQELIDYYQACHMLALPSISETFGIVQLEAMACAKPVINTNLNTASNKVSVHNETGLTVEPHSPEALAMAINTLISDDQLREKLGNNAKKRVEQFFSIDLIGEQYCQFFDFQETRGVK